MINFLEKLVAIPAIFIASLFGFAGEAPVNNLGVALPSATAVFETSLSAPITSSATSMTLAANSVKGGETISGNNCFTIDEGTTQSEFVCGSVSGTTVSSLTRGISHTTGTTTVASLQFSHRRGANVKITDFPLLQRIKAQNAGEDTYENVLVYASGVSNTSGNSTELASVGFAENLANQGSATSTETNGGIVELATLAEQANSFSGGADKPTVLQSKNSTSTCQIVGSYNVVASSTTGKIDKGCIDGSLDYTWSGTNLFTASTTLNATTTISASDVNNDALVLNTVSYQAPSSQGSANTSLKNDGTGVLSWSASANRYIHASTTNSAVDTTTQATSTAMVIPAGTMTASSTMDFYFNWQCWNNGAAANCNIKLLDSNYNSLFSSTASTESGAGTHDYDASISGKVMSNNSDSAQVTVGGGHALRGDQGAKDIAIEVSNTSSIDFSVEQTLYFVLDSTSNSSSNRIDSYYLVINP